MTGSKPSPLLAGFLLFATLFVAYAATLAFIDGPGSLSLSAGCHWDCGWYSSIIRNGYVSVIPPTVQDLDRSNVAFFPLFPILGSAAASLFSLPVDRALTLVSIVFALGICLLLPHLVDRKRAYLLLAYPATFYFFAAYSESVYCFFLFAGILLLLRRREWSAGFLFPGLFLAGAALGLTRLTGFVIPGAIFGLAFLATIFRKTADRRLLALSGVFTLGAVAGAASFFVFAQIKFGEWNLYFQTLNIGWHKEVSLTGFVRYFARALLKNIFPPIFARDPTRMSWMVTADTLVIYGFILWTEGKRLLGSAVSAVIDSDRLLRYSALAGGLVHLLITTTGDSGELHRWGNGMRYTMPVFYLLVFLWDNAWMPKFLAARPVWRRNLYYALLAFWIPFQLYYVYLFSRTIWVS